MDRKPTDSGKTMALYKTYFSLPFAFFMDNGNVGDQQYI